MDNTNGRKETHDFMNVDSFSQLPFIRRTPPKEKPAIIRLFGQELVGDNSDNNLPAADSSETKNEEISENNKDKDKDNTNRRFECHYCFRNFPTSQALGGHQNAHKRERQHAKRGSMTSYLHPHHHHHHEPHHVYGFHHHYPSWTKEARFYNGGRQQTPSYHSRTSLPHPPNPPTLNGSPLGLWRVPSSTSAKAIQRVYSASTYTKQEKETKELNWPYRLKKPNVQDHSQRKNGKNADIDDDSVTVGITEDNGQDKSRERERVEK